jgi:hypothetical protein
VDRLDRIHYASRPEDAEDAMHEFTHALLQMQMLQRGQPSSEVIFCNPETKSNDDDDDDDQARLVKTLESSHGAIRILLQATSRFLSVPEQQQQQQQQRVTPEFFNSACIALIHFAFHSRERSHAIYKQGGLGCILKILQYYRSVDYLQIIGIAALMVIGKTVGMYLHDLEATILEQIVLAMEYHTESSKVYVVACSALGTLFGPDRSSVMMTGRRCTEKENEEDDCLYSQVLYAICYGLILHLDDPVAQGVGATLLCNIVGPSLAEEMIAEVEYTHGGGMYHAAAAA